MPTHNFIAPMRSAFPRLVARLFPGRIAGAFCVAALTASVSAAHATILTVPGQYPTIQAAIDASGSGDTINVAPGTYSAVGDFNLSVGVSNLTIESTGGAAATILNNAGGSRDNQKQTVTFSGAQAASAVLKGFTIENSNHDLGGAVTIVDTSVTISQCVFIGNFADAEGGAIAVISDSATAGATITRCAFLENAAGDTSVSSGFGGAVECIVNSPGLAQNVVMTNCVFDANVSSYDGGAIDVAGYDSSNPRVSVINCSFVKNNAGGFVAPDEVGILHAADATHLPGAVSEFGGVAFLIDCALYGDAAPAEISTLSPGFSPRYSDINQSGFTGNGNIAIFPSYINISNTDPMLDNLHEQSSSPLIGLGASAGALVSTGGTVPTVDYDGLPRHVRTDIGAYEVQSPIASAQTVTTLENAPVNITLIGTDANTPPRSLTYSGTAPAHGTLTGTAPNLTYTPNADYSGADSFTFTVYNGNYTSAPATVTIHVTYVPPVLVNLTSYATVSGGINLTVRATLAQPAPAGGLLVKVSSNSPAITEGVLSFPAGSTMGLATLTTHPVNANTAVALSAPSGLGTKTDAVTVQPGFNVIAFNAPSGYGGVATTVSVALYGAAPTGGITVALSSTDTGMIPPGTYLVIPAGATGASLKVTPTPVGVDTVITASATLGAVTKSASYTVKAPVLASLTTYSAISAGFNLAIHATLQTPAPAGGFTVTVSSSTAGVSGGAITFAPGATTGAALLSTHPVSLDTIAILTATTGAVTKTAFVTVQTAIQAISFNSPSGIGGVATSIVVALYGAAPAGGIAVNLSSTDTTMIPSGTQIFIPAGATGARLTVTPSVVSSPTVITATAMLESATKTASFTVYPPG